MESCLYGPIQFSSFGGTGSNFGLWSSLHRLHAVLHPSVCLRDVVLFLRSGRTTVFGTVNAVVLYLRNFTYIYIYIHVYGSTGKHYAQVLIFLFFKDLGAHVARTRTQTSTVILVYRYLYAIPFFILNNSILGLGTTDQLANFQYVLVNCWPSHNSSFVNSFDSMLEKTKILNESQWHVWQPRNTF